MVRGYYLEGNGSQLDLTHVVFALGTAHPEAQRTSKHIQELYSIMFCR